jgi:hypothetical protein
MINCVDTGCRSGGLQQIEASELQGADVFILSFALVSRASYENVLKKVYELI